MKKILTVLVLCFLVVAVSAQWNYDGAFPDSATANSFSAIHGCVVDYAGKVWVQNYYAFTDDSILVGTVPPVYKTIRSIKVYNADGTPASFSPIRYLTFPDNSTDTLSGTVIANAWSQNTARGLGLDKDGNVLATYFGTVYKINPTTGAGMLKMKIDEVNSLTRATSSTTGDIFVANVAPGYPIRRYSNTGTFLSNVVDTSVGYSRGFEVTADGNTVWWAGYSNNLIMRYSRPNVISPYAFQDSILKGMTAESQWRDPKDGNIWVCAGPADTPPTDAKYTSHTWYKVNVSTLALMDSVTMKGDTSSSWAGAKHRAATFTRNGDTCYVTAWPIDNLLTVPYIQRFVNPTVGIIKDNNNIVSTYTLTQNYPNPFNPSTEIKFSIPKDGYVTLKVYDMLGAEVATIINGNLRSGSYTATFNASKLSSGVYVYTLNSNGYTNSKKMMLLK